MLVVVIILLNHLWVVELLTPFCSLLKSRADPQANDLGVVRKLGICWLII